MKKISFLFLSLITLFIVSCGNEKKPLENALEIATEAAELSESLSDSDEQTEATESSEEISSEAESNSGDPEIDQKLSDLEEKAEELLKKCDKIGKGVGILDIQPEQNDLLDEIDNLKKNSDLSSSQKKRLDKLSTKAAKVASKLATSTLGILF